MPVKGNYQSVKFYNGLVRYRSSVSFIKCDRGAPNQSVVNFLDLCMLPALIDPVLSIDPISYH